MCSCSYVKLVKRCGKKDFAQRAVCVLNSPDKQACRVGDI